LALSATIPLFTVWLTDLPANSLPVVVSVSVVVPVVSVVVPVVVSVLVPVVVSVVDVSTGSVVPVDEPVVGGSVVVGVVVVGSPVDGVSVVGGGSVEGSVGVVVVVVVSPSVSVVVTTSSPHALLTIAPTITTVTHPLMRAVRCIRITPPCIASTIDRAITTYNRRPPFYRSRRRPTSHDEHPPHLAPA
jgi:hypothetical protein